MLQEERRKHKRMRKPYVVRLHEKDADTGEESWDMTTAQDISAGGILLNHNKKLALDSLLDMKINFPAFAEPINCTGKVIRIEKFPNSSRIRLATIFTDVEILPRGILFWRSLTHWLGGMGIIVLYIALLPALGVNAFQLYKAEAPGMNLAAPSLLT